MEKIKAKDEHPLFQAFVTAHEGEATPEILDSENQKITFPRGAIQSIKNVVKGVIQAFKGHEVGTNSTEGRAPLGQIVGQVEKEMPVDRFKATETLSASSTLGKVTQNSKSYSPKRACMALTSPPSFLISSITYFVLSRLMSLMASDVYFPNMKNVPMGGPPFPVRRLY